MDTIRQLFDPSRGLDRRIEKVITYARADRDQLKREVTEYVVTEAIESSLERLLDELDRGFSGDGGEIGVWVSGFYGSGKSSFTKYLGFALDPKIKVDERPFIEWLRDQTRSTTLRQRLATVATRHPAAVIMIDLASEQIAGATMAEISTVLWWKVLQWAGYPTETKTAYLQLMLERDGKMDAFKERIKELSGGSTWEEIRGERLTANHYASELAPEFYPDIYKDAEAFQRQRIDEALSEDQRVKEMLELVRRRSGHDNVVFILDEVGQYIASRQNLILNLDGLAKNIKQIGGGKAWVIATAQQRLIEDNEEAMLNAASLFKLRDRFPIDIQLEATDIEEICHRRLLGKSDAGIKAVDELFDRHGARLRHHAALQGTRYYKSDFDKERFRDLYPFLPQHFTILMELLARLSKGRVTGLRSTIKVVQDILVDQSNVRPGESLLADAPTGTLATADIIFDTLRRDIQTAFRPLSDAVHKSEEVFGRGSIEARTAKAVAVLQILDDLPATPENVAALLYDKVDGEPLLDRVKEAVKKLFDEETVRLSELDGRLRFMSEKVGEIEDARRNLAIKNADLRREMSQRLAALFEPAPSARLEGTRTVKSGIKLAEGNQASSLTGDREPVQSVIEFVDPSDYDRYRDERLTDSNDPSRRNTIFLIARRDNALEGLLKEIVRSEEIYRQHRNKASDQEVAKYLEAQHQRAETLRGDLEISLKKALLGGSFIFRGSPHAVAALDSDSPLKAAEKHLAEAAEKVFAKYHLAPVQGQGDLAEKFLRTGDLSRITSQNDPLGLVATRGGAKEINAEHPALVAVKDYLENHGQVDGARLQDDFYAPPYGWSKDLTRYLVAALLVAGVVKLRVGGGDVTVKGDTAIEALKNNNNFKRTGIALRDSPLSPEAKMRAAERVLKLTGETVMPLEQEISDAVLRKFPDFQSEYAPLAARLENCGLPGADRAEGLREALREIVSHDASDATQTLGAEQCALYDDLVWARKVKAAFDEGLEREVRETRRHLDEIAGLPPAGSMGTLRDDTEDNRQKASEILVRSDFYEQIPALRGALNDLKTAVSKAAEAFAKEQDANLAGEIEDLQNSADWLKLDETSQESLQGRLNRLTIETANDLSGLKQRISHQYTITTELADVRRLVAEKARERTSEEAGAVKEEMTESTITLPSVVSAPDEVDALIARLQTLKSQFAQYRRVRIDWKINHDQKPTTDH